MSESAQGALGGVCRLLLVSGFCLRPEKTQASSVSFPCFSRRKMNSSQFAQDRQQQQQQQQHYGVPPTSQQNGQHGPPSNSKCFCVRTCLGIFKLPPASGFCVAPERPATANYRVNGCFNLYVIRNVVGLSM